MALEVGAIIAPTTRAARAAKQAADAAPMVFSAIVDAVTGGLDASLARPLGNVAGVARYSPDVIGKLLELLTQAVPSVARFAVLRPPGAVPGG